MAYKLLTEQHSEIELLHENDSNGKKQVYIEGIFAQANVKNGNGRIYPRELLEKTIERYQQEYILENRAIGEINHPDRPLPDLNYAAILTKSLKWDGDNVIGRALVMDTNHGKQVKALMESGFAMGVSTRALGSVTESQGKKIVSECHMHAVDCVDRPSGPNCFVNMLTESVEWVLNENNVWIPQIDKHENDAVNEQLFEERVLDAIKKMKFRRR